MIALLLSAPWLPAVSETARHSGDRCSAQKQELEQGRATMDKVQRDVEVKWANRMARAPQADGRNRRSAPADRLAAGGAEFAGAFHLLHEAGSRGELAQFPWRMVVQPAPARFEVVFP